MKHRGIEMDDKAVQTMLRGLDAYAEAPEQAWEESAQYMRVRTDSMFKKLRKGGTHRGVTWRPFANQYTRKSGVVVPAWGGVPRVAPGYRKNGSRMSRISGTVQGRKRPSGQRLKKSDALMQDTMRMRGTAALVVRQTNNTMELGPQGVKYAKWQNKMRRFLFFETPKDASAIGRIFAEHVARSAKTGRSS